VAARRRPEATHASSVPSPRSDLTLFFILMAAMPPRSWTSAELMAAMPPRPMASYSYAFTYSHLMIGVT
jgi:hypothetical protein